jgi:hypothetical protein
MELLNEVGLMVSEPPEINRAIFPDPRLNRKQMTASQYRH